jgi:hypothetical protein
MDVVKADDRHIPGDFLARLVQSSYSPYRGYVVPGENSVVPAKAIRLVAKGGVFGFVIRHKNIHLDPGAARLVQETLPAAALARRLLRDPQEQKPLPAGPL